MNTQLGIVVLRSNELSCYRKIFSSNINYSNTCYVEHPDDDDYFRFFCDIDIINKKGDRYIVESLAGDLLKSISDIITNRLLKERFNAKYKSYRTNNGLNEFWVWNFMVNKNDYNYLIDLVHSKLRGKYPDIHSILDAAIGHRMLYQPKIDNRGKVARLDPSNYYVAIGTDDIVEKIIAASLYLPHPIIPLFNLSTVWRDTPLESITFKSTSIPITLRLIDGIFDILYPSYGNNFGSWYKTIGLIKNAPPPDLKSAYAIWDKWCSTSLSYNKENNKRIYNAFDNKYSPVGYWIYILDMCYTISKKKTLAIMGITNKDLYLTSIPDFIKNTGKNLYNDKMTKGIPDDVLINTLYIGNMGSGKTSVLEGFFRANIKKSILCLTSRRNLSHSMKARFDGLGFVHYEDCSGYITESRVICEVESIGRLRPYDGSYDYVILDEVEEFFGNFKSDHIRDKDSFMRNINQWLNGKKTIIIALDAHPSELSRKCLETFGPLDIIKNEHKLKSDYKFHYCPGPLPIGEALHQNKKSIFATNCKGRAERVYERVSKIYPNPGDVILITGDSPEEVKALINDDAALRGCKWLIYSPTVTTGINIQVQFDWLFADYRTDIGSPLSAVQMIGRCRDLKNKKIYLKIREHGVIKSCLKSDVEAYLNAQNNAYNLENIQEHLEIKNKMMSVLSDAEQVEEIWTKYFSSYSKKARINYLLIKYERLHHANFGRIIFHCLEEAGYQCMDCDYKDKKYIIELDKRSLVTSKPCKKVTKAIMQAVMSDSVDIVEPEPEPEVPGLVEIDLNNEISAIEIIQGLDMSIVEKTIDSNIGIHTNWLEWKPAMQGLSINNTFGISNTKTVRDVMYQLVKKMEVDVYAETQFEINFEAVFVLCKNMECSYKLLDNSFPILFKGKKAMNDSAKKTKLMEWFNIKLDKILGIRVCNVKYKRGIYMCKHVNENLLPLLVYHRKLNNNKNFGK